MKDYNQDRPHMTTGNLPPQSWQNPTRINVSDRSAYLTEQDTSLQKILIYLIKKLAARYYCLLKFTLSRSKTIGLRRT